MRQGPRPVARDVAAHRVEGFDGFDPEVRREGNDIGKTRVRARNVREGAERLVQQQALRAFEEDGATGTDLGAAQLYLPRKCRVVSMNSSISEVSARSIRVWASIVTPRAARRRGTWFVRSNSRRDLRVSGSSSREAVMDTPFSSRSSVSPKPTPQLPWRRAPRASSTARLTRTRRGWSTARVDRGRRAVRRQPPEAPRLPAGTGTGWRRRIGSGRSARPQAYRLRRG